MNDKDAACLEALVAEQQVLERSLEEENLSKQQLAQAMRLSLEQAEDDRSRKRAQERLQRQQEDYQLASAMAASEELEKQSEVQRTFCAIAESETVLASQLREQNQGSWDCQICTFTNKPYAPRCEACHAKAPSHELTFRELPTMRFGVEIELLIPDGRGDGLTLESIAQSLDGLGPPLVKFCGYTHDTSSHWKIVTDSSISENTRNQDLTCELVSPVLMGEEGLQSLRTMIDHMRRVGIDTNESCGFHVHVDAEPASPLGELQALKRVAQCFCSLENAFDLLVTPRSSRGKRNANSNRYCRSNRLAFGERSSRQRWEKLATAKSTLELVKLINPASDRYRKLNMTNLTKSSRPSTLEFRQHGGVNDLLQAEAWVRLILCFCQQVVVREQPTIETSCLLPEGISPKRELQSLFELVDCAGLEQYYYMHRGLFTEDRFRNEWSCRVCLRTYSTSRSLSQHCEASGHT